MQVKEYKGKLISKQANVGSRSEGPEYFLVLPTPNKFGQTELLISKKGRLWEQDPNLHPFIRKDVIISGVSVIVKHVKFDGTLKSEGIDYKNIKELKA